MVQFTDDLRRNSVTYWVADESAQTDWENPTVAQFTAALADGRMLDITCALDEEGTTHTLGTSDLDERLTFCSPVGSSRPSGANPELTLALVRDKDRTATGIFNSALAWFQHADVPFRFIQRVGDQDTGPVLGQRTAKAIDATDDIRITSWSTDNPVDEVGTEQPALLTMTPLDQGFVFWNRKAV